MDEISVPKPTGWPIVSVSLPVGASGGGGSWWGGDGGLWFLTAAARESRGRF